MYQSLIKQFPNRKIQLMRKHYCATYSGAIIFQGMLINDICYMLSNPDGLTDHNRYVAKWITADNVDIVVYGKTYNTAPFKQLYEQISSKNLKFRSGYHQIHLYFTDFDQMNELLQWADAVETQYNMNWIHRVEGADEKAAYDTVTVCAKNLRDFQYKIFFNDTYRAPVDPQKLRNVFDQFTDSVKLTGRVKWFIKPKKELKYHYQYSSYGLYGAYFYSKSDDIITYLSLAFPQIIKKVYRLHHVEKSEAAAD
jgi:hypothetical protein